MKAYRDELKNSAKYTFGDKLIMVVSRSNSHGLDWVKPIGIIILITLFVYLLLVVVVSDKISISPSCLKEDWIYTINLFFQYSTALPQLFNPVRRLKDLFPNDELSFIVYLVDTLHRIILSIFIFQIVVAFRKFFNK